MKTIRILFACTVCLWGTFASAAVGPGVSELDFLTADVNVAVPPLAGVPSLAKAGDLAGARKVFADYVRKFYADRIRTPRPDARKCERLRKAAEEVMDYRLSACDVPYHFKNHKIDWTFNPTYNGYREWPWQFGRHKFLGTLSAYYAQTGDERAARTWRDMVESWIGQCPPPPEGTPAGATISWRTLDAGIRMMRWCRDIGVFANSPALSDEFIVRVFRSIRDHGRRLEKPMTHNNWRIMELNGLLNIAVRFPFLSRSAAWQKSALDEYERLFALQVYPDGFQFELTPGYHGVIPADYGEIIDFFKMMGKEPPAFAVRAVELSSEIYPRLTRPDRLLPALNDSSEPSLVAAMRRALRYVPERADYRWMATDGREGRPPDYLSYAFPYAGAVVFRTSWAREAVWAYMDCSPFGRSHQHEDKLNVLLSAYGRNMLVEGGLYAYDKSEMRRYVLSTRAHNTVLVDGLEQNTRATWSWKPEDISKKAEFDSLFTETFDAARAVFKAGYGSVKDAACVRDRTRHTRTCVFHKRSAGLPPFLVVIDRLEAPDARQRTYDILWHLETCDLALKPHAFVAVFGKGVGLSAAFSDATAALGDMKGSRNPYQGWMPVMPPGDHEHRPIPTPVLKGTFTSSVRIVGVLFPFRDRLVRVSSVEASRDPASSAYVLVTDDGSRHEFSEPFVP